jgi:hypothetical protein
VVFVERLVRGAMGMLADPEKGFGEVEVGDDEKGLRDALLAPGGLRRSRKGRQGKPARIRKSKISGRLLGTVPVSWSWGLTRMYERCIVGPKRVSEERYVR